MAQETSLPPSSDIDRGFQALAVLWATAGVGILVVATRFLARHMMHSTGLDDWMMLVTLGLFVLFTIILTKAVTVGGMRHLYHLTVEDRVQAAKWSWISQPFLILGFATGKISVGLFLLRIFGSSTFWRKWIMRSIVSIAFFIGIADVILTFAQCSPVNGLWNLQLELEGKAKCWPPSIQTNFAIFFSSWNILADILLAVLPATFLYNLNVTLKKRLALCVLLGLGFTAAAFATVKITFLTSLSARSDFTWETYNLYLWSGAELFVIILCGSLPLTKPVYDRLYRKHQSSHAKTAGARATSYGCFDTTTHQGRAFPSRSYEADDEVELYPLDIGSETGSLNSPPRVLHLSRNRLYDIPGDGAL